MNTIHRSAPDAGLPRGWHSRACVILILAAALAPVAAAGNADLPASAPAAPLAGGWAGGFGTPGTNHYVYSLAAGPDGSVYVGGSFTAAGNVAANCIARWDSATGTWHPLSQGMAGCDFWGSASVTALAVGPDGTLYAGGGFTTAGGVAANYIARWDGTAWHALGSGMDKRVSALAVDSLGNLYTGGAFTSAGGVAANYVARWDGTAWHPLGSGMGGCASYAACVKSLAVDGDGNLYAGGGFTTAGGEAANGIARWNGVEWQSLGSGMGGCGYDCVWSLTAGPDGSLYAGGQFTTAGGVAASNIARWDSATSTWHPLGSGIPIYNSVTSLALSTGGMLYVGGNFTRAGDVYADWIASWDGTWHALDNGVSNPVEALARSADGSIYAGGVFTNASGVPASQIAHWDPLTSSWHAVGSGNGMSDGEAWEGIRALTRDSNGVVYAGGDFAAAGSVAANRIARWDGAAWRPLSSGMSSRDWNAYVSALEIGSDGALYAGGQFERAGATWLKSIARWDGTEWQPLGDGVNGRVFALAADREGNIYAGGEFSTAGGVTVKNIARWHIATGTWHTLGGGVTAPDYYAVFALAIGSDGALYVGGYFKSAGDVPANHIARWDPATATWHALGTGMNYKVHALVCGPDGSLYAGGEFTTAGDVAANGIARWDGTSWHPLGSGTAGCQYGCSVDALTFGPDGSLYAGGNFPTAGGVTVNHIARWDGTAWHPLGSGMSVDSHDPPSEPPYVNALASMPDGSLYAGGDFRMAG